MHLSIHLRFLLPGIYSFPALRPEACAALVDEVAAFVAFAEKHQADLESSDFSSRTAVLDDMGKKGALTWKHLEYMRSHRLR